MGQVVFLFLGSLAIGIGTGVFAFSLLLRGARAERAGPDRVRVRLPFLGDYFFSPGEKGRGLFVDDALTVREKLRFLSRFLDVDLALHYAREYDITYLGFEGDREDGSWSPGKLAFYVPSTTDAGGYSVFLNPDLDRAGVAEKLSREVGESISPDEVYPFLFLHEVGHTKKAGNQNFYAAVVNLALSGRMRSLRKRRELFALRRKIEEHADRFALRELRAWRRKSASFGERGGQTPSLPA
ncbi:MAG: hypothetical protein D6713_01290 [Deltaproteobacteria bacterium]|nr:MAG: hypothetical protein D6713_01290 [Deltaproteobacteria bacterium]